MRLVAPLIGLLAIGCGAAEKKAVEAPAAIVRPPPREAPPTDEIRIEGELGTLEPEQVEAPFHKRGGDINACYQAGLDKAWYLGGALELRLRVTREGVVKSAHVLRPLGADAVERCVVGVARTLRFDAPRGGAEAEFSYSLEFRGKAALREWSEAEVGDVIAAHRPALDRCASKGPVPPSLRLTFFVGPGGVASPVGIGANSPVDERYGECVVREVGRWKFRDPRGKIARATFSF